MDGLDTENSLSVMPSAKLACLNKSFTVGQLEKALLKEFPREDACDWDFTGLRVGDPRAEVKAVAVALDPTVSAMKSAIAMGANVLVTHHPLFLDPPTSFLPYECIGQTPGSGVTYALTHGLNCINFHTACDVSVKGLAALPNLLSLQAKNPLEPLPYDSSKGFGIQCTVDQTLSLKQLAARCLSVLQSMPRVWGNPETRITSIVVCGGSGNFMLEQCLANNIDCLITGEVKYHDCLDACESGLTVIELGHDISEFPLCTILAQSISEAGIDQNCITIINQQHNWFTPDALRA